MPGGHGLLEGGATLLSSHAGPSPTGDERHSESQSGHTADSVKASQLAAGRNLSARPDVTGPIQTASVKAKASPLAPPRTDPVSRKRRCVPLFSENKPSVQRIVQRTPSRLAAIPLPQRVSVGKRHGLENR